MDTPILSRRIESDYGNSISVGKIKKMKFWFCGPRIWHRSEMRWSSFLLFSKIIIIINNRASGSRSIKSIRRMNNYEEMKWLSRRWILDVGKIYFFKNRFKRGRGKCEEFQMMWEQKNFYSKLFHRRCIIKEKRKNFSFVPVRH